MPCAFGSCSSTTAAAAIESTPTIPSDTRQLVASDTMPAIGTPITLAIVLRPMTVAIAPAAPTPERIRPATMRPKVGANAASSVATPMMAGPATRNGLRPMRSEYGPATTATAMPGAPYAATARPAVPIESPNSRASGSSTGAMTRPL